MNKWIVVTTINRPTLAIETIAKLAADGWRTVIVGDKKTPEWHLDGMDFLSVERQRTEFGRLADLIPYNHYCRKNLGYLWAIRHGADCILETDDDNIPYASFGRDITETRSLEFVGGARWINIYKYFTAHHIWPRGLPLDEIASVGSLEKEATSARFPVQQYLADLDPDVDAVYRLILNKEVTFEQRAGIGVRAGSWVPLNSQNTVFFPAAFSLLYLPCHVSFRMTDIWRSFVLQRLLWIFGEQVAFLSATVRQVRNEHNLMRDFDDEVVGYLNNKKIADRLDEVAGSIDPGVGRVQCARALWAGLKNSGTVPEIELEIFDAWAEQLA
jgi:hypothetical protein